MAWLTNWNYRKPVTISNTGSALTDYQVSVTIDTSSLVTAGKMRTDCTDIRFTTSNGSSLIYYWIESGCNTSSTKIWVKIPSIPSGTTTIYLYYGNATPPSDGYGSNGTNTFVIFDDFLGTSVDSSVWKGDLTNASVSNGIMTFTPVAGPAENSIKSYEIFSPGISIRIRNSIIQGTGLYNWSAWGFIVDPYVNPYQTVGYYTDNLHNSLVLRNTSEVIVSTDWTTGSYTIKEIIWDSSIIRWYEDNIEKTGSPYTVGTDIPVIPLGLTLARGAGQTQYVDWILVKKHASLEPTFVSSGTEEKAIEVLANSAWPKFAYNIRNNGRRPPPYLEPENTAYRIPKWWVNLPQGTVAAPAIAANGNVYVPSPDGILYTIAQNGNFDWAYNIGLPMLATPAIATNGTIYVGAGNQLLAINPNGSPKWVYGLPDTILSSPAISTDGIIYINCLDGKLYAIIDSGSSGSLKWTPHTIGTGFSSRTPVTIGQNGNVYVGNTEGILEAINSTDGLQVWSYNASAALVTSCPAISDTGVLYIGDNAGILHSILPNGTSVATWPRNLASGAISSPSLIYHPSAFGGADERTVYVATYNGILYAIDTYIDDSTYYNIIWSRQLSGNITASPTIGSDGTIYIGTLAGIFYAINPIDGSIRWSYTTFGQVKGSAAIDPNGVVYVGSAEQDGFGNYTGGRLYAFAPPESISIAGCPVTKFSGEDVTLKATPKDGTGPYYVEFRKDGSVIDPSRLNGLSNPIIDAPEDIQITRVYTLNDADISGATGGTIDFSVYIEDKCPTGSKTCTQSCIITAGCIAPVCNFIVT